MPKTTSINIRIEPELKKEVELVCNSIGMTISEVINIYLYQVKLHKGIPFAVKIPSKGE